MNSTKQSPMDQSCTSTMEWNNRELCELHGKPHILFCLSCSACICGDCLGERQHEMHHVNNLIVVYQEKVADVERKLTDAEKQLASSAVYKKNLENLEKEEEVILKTVSTMNKDAVSGLLQLTGKRKATLKGKVKLFAEKGKRLSKLRETMKKLNPKDFLTKLSVIDRQCDDMMIGLTPTCELEPVDDFKCDLVSAYTFANLTCTGFTKATFNFILRIDSACDVAWNVTVSKSPTALRVKLNPTDSGIFDFFHKLIVIIPHKDPTKEIRKPFDLGRECHTFEIVEMSHLTEHGFFTEGGSILLTIGIRPLNALVEKMLLSYNCEMLKKENTSLKTDCSKLNVENTDLMSGKSSLQDENLHLKTEISDLRKQLESITSAHDYKHRISHYDVALSLLKHNVNRTSSGIYDEAGRLWSLKIYPTMFYDCPTHVAAYITLIKGKPTKCKFFIELEHKDAQNTIVKHGTHHFQKGAADSGWKHFILWNKIADVGFHPNGNLSFRYGVKPLQN